MANLQADLREAADSKDWQQVLHLLAGSVKELPKGLRMPDRVFSNAIEICIAAGQSEAAEKVLLDILEAGVHVPVIVFNVLMKSYVRSGHADRCFALFTKMRTSGIKATAVTAGILLDAHISGGDLDKAVTLFRTMQEGDGPYGPPPNQVHFTTIIKGFVRARIFPEAMTFFDEMRNENHIRPDVVLWTTLIKAHCDAGNMKQALQLLDDMISDGCKPDNVVFNALIATCVWMKNADLGRKLLTKMQTLGVEPSKSTLQHISRLPQKCT